MLKRDEITDPNSSLNKAADDEPVFVLRAQDILASDLVRQWVEMAESAPDSKRAEALRLADAMDDWPNRKMPD